MVIVVVHRLPISQFLSCTVLSTLAHRVPNIICLPCAFVATLCGVTFPLLCCIRVAAAAGMCYSVSLSIGMLPFPLRSRACLHGALRGSVSGCLLLS